MRKLLVTLVSVTVLAPHAYTQEAPLKRLGYWGVTLRAPRPPQPGTEVTEVRADSPAVSPPPGVERTRLRSSFGGRPIR